MKPKLCVKKKHNYGFIFYVHFHIIMPLMKKSRKKSVYPKNKKPFSNKRVPLI